MKEVQMSVMETGADKLLAVVDDRCGYRCGGNHVIRLTDCDDTVVRDGDCQFTGGIDAVLRSKDVLGADNPIDMLHGRPHLWQEIQYPRVYSPIPDTKRQAANGNFPHPNGPYLPPGDGVEMVDFKLDNRI